jgi:hypothetical protein
VVTRASNATSRQSIEAKVAATGSLPQSPAGSVVVVVGTWVVVVELDVVVVVAVVEVVVAVVVVEVDVPDVADVVVDVVELLVVVVVVDVDVVVVVVVVDVVLVVPPTSGWVSDNIPPGRTPPPRSTTKDPPSRTACSGFGCDAKGTN